MATLSCRAYGAGAENSLYRFAPPQSWIQSISPEYQAANPASGVTNGAWFLLFDRQTNLTAAGDDYYVHSAVKMLSASGVDEQSQFDIEVDPTYQTVSIHSLRVARKGQIADQRSVARITALPHETELQSRIYNGTYNLNVLLSDVRVGDIVEYEYTLHSREKIFPGHYFTRTSVGWSNAVHRQSLRIRFPAGRDIRYRMPEGQPAAVDSIHGGMRELVWQWRDLLAIAADEDRPSWYSAWPALEVTDLADWSQVARRIAPLYAARQAGGPALDGVVKEIRDQGGTPAQMALRALQYVQEQIRYVSISIGPGGYVPATPATVIDRHFGDCKDKAQLLTAILGKLGIDARPALVNSRRGRALSDTLPTPYAFDHVIVRMKIGPDVFWLDGTATTQYSPLSMNAPADFERALVVDDTTTGLSLIPRPSGSASAKLSEVFVDMRAGMDKPAQLEVKTTYRGELADSTRQELADGSVEQRQSDYVNYFATYYPGAKVSAPIAIADDQAKNVIEVREHYVLEQPFSPKENGRTSFFFQPDELYKYVDTVGSSVRQSPLAIHFPADVRQVIRARLPETWPVKRDVVKIDNPAFHYESKVEYTEEAGEYRLLLDYHYVALSDSVDVAALPRYLADRKRAYDDMGYKLTYDGSPAQAQETRPLAPMPRLVALLALLLGTWAALRWGYRYDPAPQVAAPGAPSGIRGWLLLPALGACLAPFVLGYLLVTWSSYVDVDQWTAIRQTIGASYQVWVRLFLLLLVAGGVLLIVGSVLVAALFFNKRTSAPKAFLVLSWAVVAFVAAGLTFLVVSGLSTASPRELAGQLSGSVFRTAIWTVYLLRSQRVKATFVERRTALPEISGQINSSNA